MSRYYKMKFVIKDYNKEKEDIIGDTLRKIWKIEDLTYLNSAIYAEGKSFLTGGQSDEEFANEAVLRIWKAAGWCRITVYATYLEDLPCESFFFDEDKYKEMI